MNKLIKLLTLNRHY